MLNKKNTQKTTNPLKGLEPMRAALDRSVTITNEQEPLTTPPLPLPAFSRIICHWGLFKSCCQQVVQLSAHPCWSLGAPRQTEKKDTGRQRERRKEKCCGPFYPPIALTALQGMPWEEDQCRTSGFPQFIVQGQPNHLPKLKASLYDNHPSYYSHYDDGDLQMSLSVCVCLSTSSLPGTLQ